MKFFFKLFALVSFVLIISCDGKVNKNDAKAFYFPYGKFIQQTTYKYANENDSADFSFWEMRTEAIGQDTFLYTQIKNNLNERNETLKEAINGKGSIMTFYRLFSKDSVGVLNFSDCEIKADSVFKWKFNANDSVKWKVLYAERGNKMEFTKTRTFTGDTVSATIFGKEINCMEFYDRFDVKVTPPNGEPKNYSYFIQSYYARGMGMVRYKLSIPGQKRRDYSLVKITKY